MSSAGKVDRAACAWTAIRVACRPMLFPSQFTGAPAVALGNINDIATFVHVVKAGSFTVAGQQLGLTRSAVGKSIVRLEERLGVRLLNRTPRSLSLTDDGQVFYSRCTQILDDLEETELAMAVRSATPTGTLRVSVPIALGHRHVMPVLQSYLKTWADVSAEVNFTDRFVDLIDEGIDVAIRVGDPYPDSRLIARTIAHQHLLTCASPEYLQAHGVPLSPRDLADHECLFFTSAGRPQPWLFNDALTPQFSGASSRLQMDSAEALVAAAVSGVGIIALPTYLLEEHLGAGRLVALLDDFAPPDKPIRAVYPTRRHLSPKVRLFIDLLTQTWGEVSPWERATQFS
jgi:DNA-binding transcriptional LysR family regulator